MKQLHEYETPLTNEAEKDCVLDSHLLDFARDLERKLALCREALMGASIFWQSVALHYGTEHLAKKAEDDALKLRDKALAATEPKQ